MPLSFRGMPRKSASAWPTGTNTPGLRSQRPTWWAGGRSPLNVSTAAHVSGSKPVAGVPISAGRTDGLLGRPLGSAEQLVQRGHGPTLVPAQMLDHRIRRRRPPDRARPF